MAKTNFYELKKIFAVLHGKRGCLWDKKQTHKSLLPYLEEECQEFVEAVKKGSDQKIKEELGDILLQVMFHSQIASKQKRFDIEEVILGLISKLKRRHPHVFGKIKVCSTQEIMKNWHRIKRLEKRIHNKKRT